MFWTKAHPVDASGAITFRVMAGQTPIAEFRFEAQANLLTDQLNKAVTLTVDAYYDARTL